MTRKRFQKLLMSRGLSCKKARRIVETMKSTYLAMNAHTAYIYDYAQDDRYWYDNAATETIRLKPYTILSYAETWRAFVERKKIYI